MNTHISYPSIEQFRNAIRNVSAKAQYAGAEASGEPIYDNTKLRPTLEYLATIKLHGTNSAIGYNRVTNEFWYQSRSNIISITNDNAGFARFCSDAEEVVRGLFKNIAGDQILIFGEFCGKGIQKM